MIKNMKDVQVVIDDLKNRDGNITTPINLFDVVEGKYILSTRKYLSGREVSEKEMRQAIWRNRKEVNKGY